MTSALVVVMTFAVTEGLRFFLNQGSFSLWPYLFSFAVYGLCIYLTWGQRKQASMHSTTHVVARKWFWTTQLFITWHVLSIFRSIDSASTDTMIFIEELFLMIVTVSSPSGHSPVKAKVQSLPCLREKMHCFGA